jgi:hypothetical protein
MMPRAFCSASCSSTTSICSGFGFSALVMRLTNLNVLYAADFDVVDFASTVASVGFTLEQTINHVVYARASK